MARRPGSVLKNEPVAHSHTIQCLDTGWKNSAVRPGTGGWDQCHMRTCWRCSRVKFSTWERCILSRLD